MLFAAVYSTAFKTYVKYSKTGLYIRKDLIRYTDKIINLIADYLTADASIYKALPLFLDTISKELVTL